MPKSERRKKTKLWPSGRNGARKQQDFVGTLEMPSRQSQTKDPFAKYYQSINKLPLYKFVMCLDESTNKYLIISGNPSTDELDYAWNDINSQYLEAIGDAEYRHYVSTFKELTKIDLTISTIESAIECLKCFPFLPLFDFLNKTLSTNFRFDWANKEEYEKNLKRCYQRSRTLIVQRDLLKIKYQDISKKFVGSGKVDPEYYSKCLISLSDHAGYRITDKITVFEFCERMRRMINYHEKQTQKTR